VTDPETRRSLLAPAAFVGCVAVHVLLLWHLGYPFPAGRYADENVYLEIASNLWTEGRFVSHVDRVYPPLYPGLVAPAFAFTTNVTRYAVIRLVHALVFAAASLALLPAMTEALGRRRAWFALGALQLLGGVVHYGKTTQTEPLFTALLVAALGLAWSAWSSPSAPRWAAVGLVCGLALCTRRTALVLPVAFGVLAAADLVRSRQVVWRSTVGWTVGFGVGLLPELLATVAAGQLIDPYSGIATLSHLAAGTAALESWANLALAVEFLSRHLSWLAWSTAGAPLLLLAVLLGREHLPRPEARTAALALLIGAALAAITTLHMIRYRYRLGDTAREWDLYPRYVDPAEPILAAAALLATGWLIKSGAGLSRRTVAWLGAAAGGLLLLSGRFDQVRGGRLPRVGFREALPLPDGFAPWLFLALGGVVIAAWTAARLRPRTPSPAAFLVGILVISWGVSAHHPWLRHTDPKEPRTPKVLTLEPLTAAPRAPLAVLVNPDRRRSRKYYDPAFKSDHPVQWIAPSQAVDWLRAHPDGFVLSRKGDPVPSGLTRVDAAALWRIYRREPPPPP
jgi:4-amino-4-deoxy-L-arabinose transferase-like glycosyltransferase